MANVLKVNVVGKNPHDVGSEIRRSFPLGDLDSYYGVEGSHVELSLNSPILTSSQEKWLRENPNVTGWMIN
jgi:hypothetical protein